MTVEKEEERHTDNIKKGIGLGFGGCVGIVAFVVLVIIISALVSRRGSSNESTNTSTPATTKITSTPAAPAKAYQQILTFSGTGIKNSEPFTVTGDRFKIKYDCTGQLCQGAIKKPDSGDQLKDLASTKYFMNVAGNAKDETILYGSGEYYINANTMGTYTITIEDYK